MSNLGGTHTHTILEDFLSHHNTLKVALNSNLKRFAPDYLRNHLNNAVEYLQFKQVRKTLTFWYTKCQNLYKYLLTLGPIAGRPTTSLLTEIQQALKCIEFTETLLNTTNNSFLIAKAYRTVVLTYKNLSDGHLRLETQSQNTTYSTPLSSSFLLNRRISSSNYNTYCSDTGVSSGTDSRSSRTVETQTDNAEQAVNTVETEVQTDSPCTQEMGTSSIIIKGLKPKNKQLVNSEIRLHYGCKIMEYEVGIDGILVKLMPCDPDRFYDVSVRTAPDLEDEENPLKE